MIIGDILINNVRHFADRVGLIDGQTGERRTWTEINDRVNRLANGLTGLGVGKGDRVGIVSENSIQCAEFYFAVAKMGAIGCSFNYLLHPAQMSEHVGETGPKVIFHQERFESLARDALTQHGGTARLMAIDTSGRESDYELLIADATNDEPMADVGEDDILMITYTSGTTGVPKGVIATHKNRIALCLETNLFVDRYRWDDIVLHSTPFCIGVSGQAQLGSTAFSGAATVMHVLKGDTWAEVIKREKVTALLTTRSRLMPVWQHLDEQSAKPDLGSLKSVTTGGQPHTPDDLRRIIEFCGVSTTAKYYGLSETSTAGTRLLRHEVAAGLHPDATEKEIQRLYSVGKPLLSTRIRIVEEEDNELGPGEMGEIIIKGDCVSPGYWNNAAMTEKAFRNGWFHTGDIGTFDEDGYLYIKGRKDFMINTGGIMVSAAEVENCLRRHPLVSEAAVIGVPDERWGEAVTAVVRLTEKEVNDERALHDFCRRQLAGFQVPKRFLFVDAMPKDVQGRIDIRALYRDFAGHDNEHGKGIG
ncbi:MAG: AMP-binding protein [Alphaproteobacteria bacterium]|nr:AMP-binding protein [Alphaproteobacteria bacterium]